MNRISKDDIKTLIVVVLVCAICVSLVLLLNIKSNSEKLEAVKEYNTFFSTSKYVNSYLNYLSNSDEKAVYDLLYKEYIEEHEITEYNILSKLDYYPKNVSVKVKQMEYVKIKNNYVYHVKGKLIQNDYNYEKVINDNFEIIVINDFNNLSIAIYPIDNVNYKKVIDKIKKIDIDKNTNNSISNTELITKEQICVTYLSDYLNQITNDLDSTYDLLNLNMQKRFTTLDSYKEYINSNISKFSTEADKCKMEEIDNNRVYTVIDKNGNSYIFNEESIMNYKVDLYLNDKDNKDNKDNIES